MHQFFSCNGIIILSTSTIDCFFKHACSKENSRICLQLISTVSKIVPSGRIKSQRNLYGKKKKQNQCIYDLIFSTPIEHLKFSETL